MAELGGGGVAQRHQGVGREPRAVSHGVAGYLPGGKQGPPCPGLGQDPMGRGSGDPSQTLPRGLSPGILLNRKDSPQLLTFTGSPEKLELEAC